MEDLLERMTTAAELRGQFDASAHMQFQSLPEILISADGINSALLRANWVETDALTRQIKTQSEAVRQSLHQMAQDAGDIDSLVHEIAPPLHEAVSEIFGSIDTSEVEELIARVILDFDITGATRPEGMEDLMRAMFSEPPPDLAAIYGNYSALRRTRNIALISRTAILGLVRALWAEHLRGFNVAYRSLSRAKGTVLISRAIEQDMAETLDTLRDQLGVHQEKLHAEQADAALRTACDEASSGLPAGLGEISVLQARLYLAGHALRRLGKGERSEQIGGLAVQAAGLAREYIATYAAALRIADKVICGFADVQVTDYLNASRTLPFDGRDLADGTNIAIHNLDEGQEGQFIEIRGYVKSIQTGRIDGGQKLITRALLTDPSSGANVRACCIFLNFRHLGVTGGSFIQASGIYRHSSGLANGLPAVEVDRLALTELAAENRRIALLMLSSPWFEVWRNAQNLVWSLGPQSSRGAGTVGLDGAMEPVFTPLLREQS